MKMSLSLSIGALLISSISSAATMTCAVNPFLADKGGFLMPGETKKISTIVKKDSDISLKGCTETKIDKVHVTFCAGEHDYVGGYSVMMSFMETKDVRAFSQTELVTMKKTGELREITREYEALPSFLTKMNAAGIETPYQMNSDSAQVDDAVKAGIAKGVLKHGDAVIMTFNNCSLSK